MNFRNPYNVSPDLGEFNTGEIITVPNQSYSIKELLQRFVTGQPLPNLHDYGRVQDDEDFDDVISDPVDLTDIENTRLDLARIAEKAKSKPMSNPGSDSVSAGSESVEESVTK